MSQPNPINQLDRICPPFLAYYYALRNPFGTSPLSVDDLSRQSGIPRRTVIRIGSKISWGSVKHGTILRFLDACGLPITKVKVRGVRRITNHLRKQLESVKPGEKPFGNLTDLEYRHFNTLCQRWMETFETTSDNPS